MAAPRPRLIVHVDMDAFFAAIEVRQHPELRGRPVIVGGDRDSRRGVVATCSYEARRFGVRSAMPIRQAVALCPHGVFLPGRPGLYRQVSRRIMGLLAEFSPVLEMVSIDEAYLDMTEDRRRFPDVESIAHSIRARIYQVEHLTASVGIGPNKFLAKLATELCKPDGYRVIAPEAVDAVLVELPVSRLPGVGPRTARRLESLGLRRVADVRAYPATWLGARLGRFGHALYLLAWGIDTRPVRGDEPARSISSETTFADDLDDRTRLRHHLAELAAEVGRRLRAEGLRAGVIEVKARYRDFTTLTRRLTLPRPVADDASVYAAAAQLFDRVPARPGGFRLLGVAAGGLTRITQLPLLEAGAQATKGMSEQAPAGAPAPSIARQEVIDRTIDMLNTRYRRLAITRGRLLEAAHPTRNAAGRPPRGAPPSRRLPGT